MSPREADIAYALPNTAITLEVWSSDYINFQLGNKAIKTTLDNTVSDIKNLIAERSQSQGGLLNTKAMKLLYKNREYKDTDKLSSFLVQENYNTRVQIELDVAQLGIQSLRQWWMNVHLKLSNGKTLKLREPLTTNIRSIKDNLVEDLHLEGIHDIITLEYNAGVEIQDRDQLTLGELLDLDTVPVSTLNIYVRLKDDFIVRLSSPTESILRITKLAACLDTEISYVKQFIVDQYTGEHNIDISDVKIIYFGRVLNNEEKMSQIVSGTSSVDTLITLHFVINEPTQTSNQSGGFWSDLRRGASLFEFLPLEPNPNFEADLERDRRLRERLAGNAIEESDTEEQVIEETEEIIQSNSTAENSVPEVGTSTEQSNESISPREFQNAAPVLPNTKLTGEAYDRAIVDGEEVFLNQTDTSSTVYQITLQTAEGIKEVKLSSSQVIINNSDPSSPYVMLSPAGFAKLQSLGVEIQPPNVVQAGEDHANARINQNGLSLVEALDEQSRAFIGNAAVDDDDGLAPGNLPAPPRNNQAFVNVRRFSIRINSNSVTRIFSIVGRLAYHALKISLFYNLIITQIPDTFQKRICLALLIFYIFTNGSIRNLLHQLKTLLPTNYQAFIDRYIEAPERNLRLLFSNGSETFMTLILESLPSRPARSFLEIIDNLARTVIVSFVLFFTSMFPNLHNTFRSQRRNSREREARRRRDEEREREAANIPAGIVDEAIDATGAQIHHEN